MQRVGASSVHTPLATACCILISILVGILRTADLVAPEEAAPSATASGIGVATPIPLLSTASDIAGTTPMQGESGEEDDGPGDIVIYEAKQPNPETNPPNGLEPSAIANPNDPVTIDYGYLVQTAASGGTMTRQGPELAIGRLHPEFVRRRAAAIQEARQAGLPRAGSFSAYRPPAFGVGGFSHKFNAGHLRPRC